MATDLARQKAAQAWCTDKTSNKEMDADLCEAFAEILDYVWTKPWLGNATTAELLNELTVRSEVGGYANYRTVDGDI